MIQITKYENGIIYCYCECDGVESTMDITSQLEDDCVLSFDMKCPKCGSSRSLYILICKTESKAKELVARLEVLRLMGR